MVRSGGDGFDGMMRSICHQLNPELDYATRPKAQSWQSVSIDTKPEMQPIELSMVVLDLLMDRTPGDWAVTVLPNLPWAEEHFQERVSGEPLNPPPSHVRWPYARKNNDEFTDDTEKFSHTYPERFWPKSAGLPYGGALYDTAADGSAIYETNRGIRYAYGDLQDVVELMQRDLYTRQAYLPVWFPEDTGVAHGERVPCTLGYHFLYRDDCLNLIYNMRSCDLFRYFRDDVYMAGRLCQWMADELRVGRVNKLTMTIGSLHIFEGDLPRLYTINTGRARCP